MVEQENNHTAALGTIYSNLKFSSLFIKSCAVGLLGGGKLISRMLANLLIWVESRQLLVCVPFMFNWAKHNPCSSARTSIGMPKRTTVRGTFISEAQVTFLFLLLLFLKMTNFKQTVQTGK